MNIDFIFDDGWVHYDDDEGLSYPAIDGIEIIKLLKRIIVRLESGRSPSVNLYSKDEINQLIQALKFDLHVYEIELT